MHASFPRLLRLLGALLPGLLAGALPLRAATLTVGAAVEGTTPAVLGYNLGHFMPGSNTADWWRYSGVKAARVFLSPSFVEASDDLAGRGDGVTDAASFLARRAALRANAADPAAALDPQFINWPYFLNRYANATGTGNRLRVDYALGELRRQNVEFLVQITASLGSFPIADAADWAGKWELWQHFYAQAFYLGREYDVRRYSMFNEPNHSAAGGITVAQWQERLELASDAIQAALADLNARYGRNLVPEVFAPTTASATGSALEDWGVPAVQLRHQRFDGTTDPAWRNLQGYSYQSYSTSSSTFASNVATVRTRINGLAPGEPQLPIALTEFNTSTGANFDQTTLTLDGSTHYSSLAATLIALTRAGADQLYLFKFGQTLRDAPTTYPVAKNGTHYVNNDTGSSVNNYGGATKAAEVYRLFNRAAAGARPRLAVSSDAGTSLAMLATRDATRGCWQVFLVNTETTAVSVDLDVTAWGVSDGATVLVEEVSAAHSGGLSRLTAVSAGRIPTASMAGRAIWLVTVYDRALVPTHVTATDDLTVADGTGRTTVADATATLEVRADGTADGRRATLIKVPVSTAQLAGGERFLLRVRAGTQSGTTPVLVQVYGIEHDAWQTGTSSWSTLTAPLRQNVGDGNRIAHNVVAGQGTSAALQGTLVFSSTTAAERFIDVTDFVRQQADGLASFLIVQPHRWDYAPTDLAGATPSGDTQGSGIVVEATESGNGPRLVVLANPDLTITGQPAAQTVPLGGTATFSVTVQSFSAVTYQWRRDGIALPGATAASLTLTNVQAGDVGAYTVLIANAAGNSVESAPALLALANLPLATWDIPVGTATSAPVLSRADGVAEAAAVTLAPGLSIVSTGSAWRLSGFAAEQYVQFSLTAGPAAVLTLRQLLCKVTPSTGSTGAWTQPRLEVRLSAAGDFSASVTAGVVALGPDLGSASTGTETGIDLSFAEPWVVPAGATVHVRVYGLGGSGTAATSGARLSFNSAEDLLLKGSVAAVQPTPEITWAQPAAIHYGTTLSSTQLNATASVAGTFVYDPPVGTLLDAGEQVLTVTFTPDDLAQHRSTTVSRTLTVAPAPGSVQLGALHATYDGTAKAVTTATQPAGLAVDVSYDGDAAAPVDAGSYAVLARISDPNHVGEASATLVIEPASQSIAFAALPAKAVGDAPFVLSAQSSSGLPVQFRSTDPAVATVEGATVTLVGEGSALIVAEQPGDHNHAAAEPVARTLVVNTRPAIVTAPLGRSVTAGDRVEFTVVATGTAPLTYQWRREGGVLAGAGGPSLVLPSVQASDAGTYDVVVSNAAGSATSAAAVLTVMPAGATWAAWRARYFDAAQLDLPAVSGFTADPDGDGRANGLEFALGLDPWDAAETGPVAGLDAQQRLTLTFARQAVAEIAYEVQAGSDPASWQVIWSSAGEQNVAGPLTVTDAQPVGPGQPRFLRLVVRLP